VPSKRLGGLTTVLLPDQRHTLLLRAVAWNDDRARRTWDAWRSQVTPEIVTDAEAWLLAAAYRPLRRLGAADPMVSLAGGVYRRAWYVNQLALKRGADVIADLRAAGVEVIVLNGAALSLLHYRDAGARPFEHLDMLAGPGGEVWETRVPFELMGTPTFALAAPEQLVHTCTHAAGADDVAAVSWVADATAVLRSAGAAFDWERVLELAHGRRVAATVGEALGWLRQSLDTHVPVWVLDRLSAGGTP
jgi:hypothetical protein